MAIYLYILWDFIISCDYNNCFLFEKKSKIQKSQQAVNFNVSNDECPVVPPRPAWTINLNINSDNQGEIKSLYSQVRKYLKIKQAQMRKL